MTIRLLASGERPFSPAELRRLEQFRFLYHRTRIATCTAIEPRLVVFEDVKPSELATVWEELNRAIRATTERTVTLSD